MYLEFDFGGLNSQNRNVNIRCLLVTAELLLNEIKSEGTIILLLDTVTETFSKVLLVYMSFTWVLVLKTVAQFILHRL